MHVLIRRKMSAQIWNCSASDTSTCGSFLHFSSSCRPGFPAALSGSVGDHGCGAAGLFKSLFIYKDGKFYYLRFSVPNVASLLPFSFTFSPFLLPVFFDTWAQLYTIELSDWNRLLSVGEIFIFVVYIWLHFLMLLTSIFIKFCFLLSPFSSLPQSSSLVKYSVHNDSRTPLCFYRHGVDDLVGHMASFEMVISTLILPESLKETR